ncbi:hypothetical protein LTR56_006319 [Elasticomyces elasticus]|nr:hypothetical protein LTR56_006319 [Elasticomyces elasticus]KAK3663367.1 hypothetical protein LTR22_005774 [Elasticomyces elasticus]KAK4925446.1 hypothetical protein LTR49_007510 [Elasticomyces elasticus]KAK5764541.1 hypothetical protein LTS12_005271 [Elasticomyces elasticus]
MDSSTLGITAVQQPDNTPRVFPAQDHTDLGRDVTPESVEVWPIIEDADGITGVDEYCEDDFAAKYTLRPQTRATNQNLTCTWLDEDETGDFDPNEEERKVRIQRSKVKLRQRQDHNTASSADDEAEPNERRAPRQKLKLIVKLKIRSEPGKTALSDCLSKPPAGNELSHDDYSDGYLLRTRTRASTNKHGDGSTHVKLGDEHDLPKDLTGHPIARGCWGCVKVGIRCPLLDDEHAWPCRTCIDDDHECDLITPPKIKRGCESTKCRKAGCSYTYTLDHTGPCEACASSGHHCVAGPDKDTIPTRIRYDRDWANNPLPLPKKRKPLKTYWTCMQCRQQGRDCSFGAGGAVGDDCTACEMEANICIPEQTNTPPRAATSHRPPRPQKRRAEDIEHFEQETPTKRPKPAPRRAKVEPEPKDETPGTTATITTKFCHPIVFNNQTTEGTNPCNFCDGTSTAIAGLEQKEVEVIDWEDGRGLTEVSGGHMAEGFPNTRVCEFCTTERVAVMMCAKHVLRPIPKAQPDIDGALTALFSGTLRKKDRWCSICLALATYECETACMEDAHGRPRLGCGLLLCETCMPSLAGLYDGDLQAMLNELEDEPNDERPLGLRADYQLLKEEGMLMRYVMWANQQWLVSSQGQSRGCYDVLAE